MTIHYNSSQIFPTCLKSIEHHTLDAISSIDKKQPLDDFLLHSGDLNPISIHKTFFQFSLNFIRVQIKITQEHIKGIKMRIFCPIFFSTSSICFFTDTKMFTFHDTMHQSISFQFQSCHIIAFLLDWYL